MLKIVYKVKTPNIFKVKVGIFLEVSQDITKQHLLKDVLDAIYFKHFYLLI